VLDPTVAIDEQGTVVVASDSVEGMFGWTPAELVGRNVNVLMPEPHRGLHDRYLASYRATGETNILGRTREFTVVDRQGRPLEIELSVSRVSLPGHERPLFIGSFRDISVRKEAERRVEESERRLRAIFEGTFQFIGLLSPDGTVLEANQTALQATGATREEVVGRPFWETRWWSVSEEARKQLREAILRAADGEFVRFETIVRGRGDEVLTIDFSLKPVFDGAGKVSLLIPEGRDITQLKRAQRSETAMLRALATIGESAAMLAHEIKNPITAVNLALRAVAHQLGEDHKQVLEDLVGRMQRLEQTMRRTLSYARPLDLQVGPIRVADLLAQVVRDLRHECVKRGAEVTTEAPDDELVLTADRQLVGEVLTNLVKNALEALGRRGHVVLGARTLPGQQIEITIEDDGPGIPDSMADTLFKPFVTSKRSGTGLGLAFCKKVAEEHGGSIRAERGRLGGARFVLELPMA
jgi:PAS domain S-box-containing protein